MRFLVTGGLGYIGRHVAGRLRSRGEDVAVLSRRPASASEFSGERITADVRSSEAVSAAIRAGDVVIHLACTAVGPSMSDPASDFSANALGTFNVLEAARLRGAARVVLASSSEVYGPPMESPIAENHQLNPQSPYGASKAAGDLYAGAYRFLFGLPTIVLRLFNVFGPSFDGTPRPTVETLFARNAAEGRALTLKSPPETTKDFVYIDDVIAALIAAADNASARGVYNIGSGRATSLREIAIAAGYPEDEIGPSQNAGLPVAANTARAAAELGFRPTMSVLSFVEELARGFGSQAPAARSKTIE